MDGCLRAVVGRRSGQRARVRGSRAPRCRRVPGRPRCRQRPSVGAGTSAVPEAGRRAASCAMCILAGVRTLQQGRTYPRRRMDCQSPPAPGQRPRRLRRDTGYLRLPAAIESIAAGDASGAYAVFCEAEEIGDRFGNLNLVALARHGRGRALIRMGEVGKGVVLLDEAMVAIEAGEVSPLVIGTVTAASSKDAWRSAISAGRRSGRRH